MDQNIVASTWWFKSVFGTNTDLVGQIGTSLINTSGLVRWLRPHCQHWKDHNSIQPHWFVTNLTLIFFSSQILQMFCFVRPTNTDFFLAVDYSINQILVSGYNRLFDIRREMCDWLIYHSLSEIKQMTRSRISTVVDTQNIVRFGCKHMTDDINIYR